MDNFYTTICCSHMMSMTASPPKKTNLAPSGWPFGSQQCAEHNVGASDNYAGNTPSRDTQFGQPLNDFHPPPVFSYLPGQATFPGAPQFFYTAPFNITPALQPSSAVTQGYPRYRPWWQGYNFPPGSNGGPQMFPPQQFTGKGPSSPPTPQVPPTLPGNGPVIRPTSFTSTPYGKIPGTPMKPPNSLPMKRFQPAAKPRRIDFEGIAELPPLPEIAYDKFDADYQGDDPSDWCGAESKAPISLKQTEFSLKQFAKWMGQPNFSTFNNRKNG